MITCKECGYECSAQNALGYHLRNHGLKYPDYVVKHEHDGVWPACLTCKKQLPYKKGGFGSFCGKSCATSGDHNGMAGLKGEASPNFGKVRTEEHRTNYRAGSRKRWDKHGDKLRAMMQTPEYRKAQADSQHESWKTSPTRREQTLASIHRFWSSDSPETHAARKAASERAIIQLELGQIGPQAPYKTEWKPNPFTGREEYMHSSWETAFLDKCISEGYPVTKSHSLRIPYVDPHGAARTYVPDFIGLEEKIVFEIKGNVDEEALCKKTCLEQWAVLNDWETVLIDFRSGM